MFNIAQYLDKFKNFGKTDQEIKKTLVIIIEKVVGVEIDTKNIILKGGEIIIKASPAIKNSIYIKKETILKELKEKFDSRVGEIR